MQIFLMGALHRRSDCTGGGLVPLVVKMSLLQAKVSSVIQSSTKDDEDKI